MKYPNRNYVDGRDKILKEKIDNIWREEIVRLLRSINKKLDKLNGLLEQK